MHRFTPLAAALLLTTGCASDQGIHSEQAEPVVPWLPDLGTPRQVDKLVQLQVPQVDVLWVIDNSCSMGQEQLALTTNFPLFMDYFLGSGLDYHIGVVSTDMNNPDESGKLRTASGYRYIDDTTAEPSEVFAEMASLGIDGHFEEMGLDATYTALERKKNGFNAGFLREDAALHVIVISDENDKSVDIAPAEFVTWMRNTKWSEELTSFSSIVSPNPVCPDALEPGDTYTRATEVLGGISWSICADDWAQVLAELGIQASGLKREYFLSRLPVPGSVTVSVVEDGTTFLFQEGRDWTYTQSRNSVVFNEYIPSPLAQVWVEYDVRSGSQENELLE